MIFMEVELELRLFKVLECFLVFEEVDIVF
jgi:hypothetical protein